MKDIDKIPLAVSFLKEGGVVAFPTETVYGLGASIYQERGIETIFSLKGRAKDNPLIVHIHSLEQVPLLAREIPEDFYRLAEAFFPGPLTIILPKKESISLSVTAHLDTVAFRMPSHPLALALLKALDEPIAAPSANLSGKPSPTCYEHVAKAFFGKIPLILDGGECEVGIESTVISLVDKPTLLRPGVVTGIELQKVLKKQIAVPTSTKKVLCPGMKYAHYAPQATIFLFEEEEKLVDALSTQTEKKVWVFSNLPVKKSLYPVFSYSSKNLYSLFHNADEKEIQIIYLFLDTKTKEEKGLCNRIFKAACGCYGVCKEK